MSRFRRDGGQPYNRARQHEIEVGDTLTFEQYRHEYTSPARLG